MRTQTRASAARAVPIKIESLETRSYLSADLIPGFVGALPATLIAGQKTHDILDISLTNTGDSAYKSARDPAKLTIFASSMPYTNADEAGIIIVPVPGTIAAGATRNVHVHLKSIPASFAAGVYYFDSHVAQSPIQTADAFALGPTTIQAPSVDLTLDIAGIVRRSRNGKFIIVQVIVNNDGNIPARGPLRVAVEFSADSGGVDPLLFRTITTPIKITAGGSKTVRVAGNIPKSFPALDYHMIVVLNGNQKITETDYGNDTQITASYFYLP